MSDHSTSTRRRWLPLALLLAALVFASRWPFLSPGFGTDFDSWLLADAARWIHLTGKYHASRRPGYPVSELLFACAHDFGARGLNGVSAAACALSAALLATLVRRAGDLRAWLTGALFAATPLIFVASTSTMDYLPSLAFLLAALCAALAGHTRAAAVLLALMIGARGANAPLAVAVAAAIWVRCGGREARRLALWTLPFALLCYAPVVLFEDAGAAYFVPMIRSRPPVALVLERASVETWGQLGLAAMAVGVLLAALPAARRWRVAEPAERALLAALFLVTVLSAITFLAFPLEAGYLAPAVVGACGLVGMHLRPPALAALVALVAVSGFFDVGGAGGGVVGRDQAQRERDAAELVQVLQAAGKLKEPTVVLTGPAHARVLYYAGFLAREPAARVRFVQAIASEARAREVLAGGEALRFVDGVDVWLRVTRGVDIVALGARPLIERP